ncbi:IFN protein, partial [Psilopogon haemacephalus]|nr:IFN protein [Psilopogon haemacephalus]
MAVPATPQPRLRHSTPVLLLLLTAPATTCACHHLHAHDATFSWESLQLLQTMAPSPTQPCQHQQAPTLPSTLLHNSHPQQAATITLRILQHLFAIFSSPSSPQHWDARAQAELLNILHHRIHHLEQCLPANGMFSKRKTLHNLQLSIDKYFMSIQDFLHTHNHSTCAWDHVRLQARACFQHMDTLIRQMK